MTDPIAAAEAPAPTRHRAMDLLLDPHGFFARGVPALTVRAQLAIAAVMGLAASLGRVNLMAGNGPLATDWGRYWGTVVTLAVMAGPLRWFLGGALFRLLVRFAGARGANPREVRTVFMLSDLVWAIPMVVWALVETVAFAAPLEVPLSVTLLASVAWGQFVGYQGVRARFPVGPWKARIWFLILPGLFYGALFVKQRWF